jgi:hypothetical protein
MLNHPLLVDLKQFLELDDTYTDKDAMLNMLLKGAEDFINSRYKIVLRPTTKIRYFSGDGFTNTLYMPTRVARVLTLKVDGTLVDPEDYILSNNNAIILKTGTFAKGVGNIEVHVGVGYYLGDLAVPPPGYEEIPGDLKVALFKLVEKLFNDATQNRDGVNAYTADVSQRATFYDKIPRVAELTFNAYMTVGV